MCYLRVTIRRPTREDLLATLRITDIVQMSSIVHDV